MFLGEVDPLSTRAQSDPPGPCRGAVLGDAWYCSGFVRKARVAGPEVAGHFFSLAPANQCISPTLKIHILLDIP